MIKIDNENTYFKVMVAILAVMVFIVILLGAFTLFKPKDPQKMFNESFRDRQEIPFEQRPGITNVGKISEARNKSAQLKLGDKNATTNGTVRPTRTPKPLPYPRIEINYTRESVDTIGDESAGEKNKFMILKMSIRNYGYKYFDAHPTKFNIVRGTRIIDPIVNVSTGNMLDAIIPNNSRAKGDIVFLLSSREASGNPKLKYKSDEYKILFKRVDSIEDKVEDEDEDEKDASLCKDYNYEEEKCYD